MTEKKRKPGRPVGTTKPDGDKVIRRHVTLRPDQLEKFNKLGGSKWLRERIDQG